VVGVAGAFSQGDRQNLFKKLGVEHTVTRHFGHEGLVKTKLFKNNCEK
jgi:precorrin-6x reductase